jgi:hypothetical protein
MYVGKLEFQQVFSLAEWHSQKSRGFYKNDVSKEIEWLCKRQKISLTESISTTLQLEKV